MGKKISILLITVLAAGLLFAQGLQYEPPVIEGYEPPFSRTSRRSPFSDPNPSILRNEGKMFTDTAAIDFEKRQLTFSREDAQGNRVWTYHYGELNDYITDRKANSFYEDWYNKLTEERKEALRAPPPPRLQWELAVHYPPWAQRLLGNEPPRLKIEGRLRLTAAYERTSKKAGEEAPEVSTVPLDFQTEYDFAIRGSVGRLISVNISHSKQDGFDFGEDPLKNIRVEYKESYPGELEDEIIQEIVAGYMGFDMPGTNLSGYSDKHDGLFGVKMRAKLGPLMLTAVASHAQGEALTRELGGRNDPNATAALRVNDYIKNRYFFLDPAYRDFYNRTNNTALPPDRSNAPPRVTQFQALISIQCGETAQSTTRRFKAMIDGSEVCFKMLTENVDYTVDVDRGFARFEHNVRDEDFLIMTLTTVGSLNKGRIVPNNAPNNSLLEEGSFYVLKPRSMEDMTAAHPTFGEQFGLMWRNVYFLSELEDGRLDVFFLDPAVGDTIRHATVGGQSLLLSRVLGLTDDQGRARVENVEVFNLARQELAIPPWSAELHGNEPFANPAFGGMTDTMAYRLGSRTTFMTREYVPKFGIVTGGAARKTSYDDLGWNILEGTVTVKTNTGTVLIEGEDYELDYQMGVIDLLSTRARAAESIFITYQRESDFVLERKVFAGLRGEMRLPFISENSFMAASVLYQNAATSSSDVPQLGNEPFSKLHLSYNTSLDFQPEWMTKAVSALPFVETEAASAAKVDFEIVHSRMNSNTSRYGAAYLDDFERSKDAHMLSLRHTMWHPSHYPFDYRGHGSGPAAIAAHMFETGRVPAWDFYWFTPNSYDNARLIRKREVWEPDPNRSYTSSDDYIDVLRLHATPAPNAGEIQGRFANSYASITTSFGRNGLNMENHRYLEMVVRPRGPVSSSGVRVGNRGKLMIQIGTFSHDQMRDGGPPNGRFDIEDTTYQNRAELLSQFDRGLNWRESDNAGGKFYVIPNADRTGWDTLSANRNTHLFPESGVPRGIDNPSGDRFHRYDRDNIQNFRFANGSWGNSLYDSENIDNDGVPRVTIGEAYYTYVIDLDNLEHIDSTARVVGDWRFLRIPLDVFSGVVGAPDISKMRGMRLVWYDFDWDARTTENELHIAGLELVGSNWEPIASGGRIEPSTISNQEDAVYAQSVREANIVRVNAGEQTPIEQSLRLNFNVNGGDTALVRKNMHGYPQNISGYDSVSIMFNSRMDQVFGDALKLVLRFGSDDSTYYEYAAPIDRDVSAGWQRRAFSLNDLSELKLRADLADSLRIDAPNGDGSLRVVAPRGRRPNFTAITYMAVGVASSAGGAVRGEIWVNELKVTGARNLAGVAARFNMNTQWADVLSLGVGAAYTSGEFRTMTDAMVGNESKGEITANINAKLRMDAFLPEEWGVSIPVGGSISGSLSRPTIKPQSDIRLVNDDGSADGFLDMVTDAFNLMTGREAPGEMTKAQEYETFSTTRNLYTSFEKTSESGNPLINFTLDRIKTDISYNVTESHTARGMRESGDGLYMRTDTTVTYTGNLRYDLSPRNPPEWTSLTPFSNSERVPKLYRNYKFNLLPSTITFDLAEVQHRTETRNDPKLNVHNFTTRTFDMRHGLQVNYAPIDPLLNLGYSVRFDRDLSDVPTRNDWDVISDTTLPRIFGFNDNEGETWDDYWILYGERGRSQTASAKLVPQFVGWMTHSAEYTAGYSGQTARRDSDSLSTQFLNTGVNTSLRLRSSLMLTDFFKSLANVTEGGRPPVAAPDSSVAADSAAPPARKGFFERLADGAAKINMRTVNFEYDAQTDLKQSFLSSAYFDQIGMSNYDFFRYQLGMGRDFGDYFFGRTGDDWLGWIHYRSQTGENPEHYRFDQSTGSWSARFSTAFTIPDPFKINFTNVSYGWGREFAAQPDTAFIDTTIVLPEIRASANTELLTRLSFVRRRLSRLGLTSTASYKNTRRETRDRSDTTVAIELQPLVSLEGKWIRWPALSTTYRYGRTNTSIVSGTKGVTDDGSPQLVTRERTIRNSHTAAVGYEFANANSRLQEIKVWRWVIPVQGKTSVGLAVNLDYTVKTTQIGEEEEQEERQSDFNYSPFVTYKFTENISGQARYIGTHKNQDGLRTDQQRFELAVEVAF